MRESLFNDISKNVLYENDISYRIVCNIAKIYWSNQYKKELCKLGLMIIKPEAIITGKTAEIFSILKNAGYELIYFAKKNINATCTKELWKYSWIYASLEHILINQKLFSLCDSLILILRTQNAYTKPVPEMLTDLKGSALECKRKPYQIRSKITPINYVLNYVHTSDDIDDFIREIGILLDWDDLIQVFKSMESNYTIPYPNIEVANLYEQKYTLDKWLNNIYAKMNISNIASSDKTYILKYMQILKKQENAKITLEFLNILCLYELIEWDFETIVVLSSNINYLQ